MGSWAPHNHLLTLLQQEKRIRKVRKLMGWDKDSLINNGQAKNNEEFIAYFPLADSNCMELRSSSLVMLTWEDKHRNWMSSPCLSPGSYSWAWDHMVWDILRSVWVSFPGCAPLPDPFPSPASLLVWQYKKQKSPWLCKHYTGTTTTTNPKQCRMSC